MKTKRVSLLMIAAIAVGLLAAAGGTFAFTSKFNQNRFAGIWHLQQANVLPEGGDGEFFTPDLDSLESCSIPTQVSNNTPDPHYESQCFYMNISNIRRQAFKLYIFKNEEAKIRYYGSDLSRHPCRLGETPLIESDLYVMRPEANLVRKQERVEGIYAKLKEFDRQTILLQKGQATTDYTACDDHVEALASQYQQIGAGTPRRADTEIDSRCAVLQVSVDSVYTDNPIEPSNQAFADCLGLRGPIRQDFIDSLVLVDYEQAEGSTNFFASHGWYSPAGGPVVEWYSFDTAASLALVAMHEYLHKVYFEDLSSAERIKLRQEMLRLVDSDDPGTILPAAVFPQEHWDKLSLDQKIELNPYGCSDSDMIMEDTGLCTDDDRIYHNSEYSAFIDYLGQDSLNNEVMIRIGRHSPTPFDFVHARNTLRNMEDNISYRSEMIDEMLAVLSPEIRQDYLAFLLDDYGLFAFMREVREIEELDNLISGYEEREIESDSTSGTDFSFLTEGLDKLSYDKRLAAGDGEASIKEQLEEILLKYYDEGYDGGGDWEDIYDEIIDNLNYRPPDSFSVSRLIAEASCEPDCSDESLPSEESPDLEPGPCNLADDACDIDQLLEYLCEEAPEEPACKIVEHCQTNPEDRVCLLFEDCKDQANQTETASQICDLVIEHCGNDLENEACQPDWPDEEYCLENINSEDCWPDLPDEDLPELPEEEETDEQCIELEDGEVVCRQTDDQDEEFPTPYDIYTRIEEYGILSDIYSSRLDAIFVEGYPIIALEVKEGLPSWLEQHFSQFLDQRQDLADYLRRRS